MIGINFAFAQDSISFKLSYMPMHEYIESISKKTKTEITFSGEDSVLKKLSSSGMANPNVINSGKYYDAKIITGKLNADNKFPVVMNINMKNDAKSILPNMTFKVLGSATTETLPVMDSVVVGNISVVEKKSVLLMINKLFEQIELPNVKMVIGQVYVKTNPINLQTPKVEMNMIATTKYTLISVTDSTANFDISVSYSMNTDAIKNQKISFNGFGEGSGKMVYQRKYNYPVKNELAIKLDLSSEENNNPLKIHILLETSSIQNIHIHKL